MHHDRRPAALILLGVTETDALHLPVIVTNLKCAPEGSFLAGPGVATLRARRARVSGCCPLPVNVSKSRRPIGPAAATLLGLTPSSLPVFLPRASRHVSRIGRHLSRLVRRGDDRDTRRPSSLMPGTRAGARRRSRSLLNALFLDYCPDELEITCPGGGHLT